MKKIFKITTCLALAVCMIFGCFANAFAESLDPNSLYTQTYIVEDLTTGKVLAENNADERMYIASLTKMMTAIVVMDYVRKNNISMQETIVVSDECIGLFDSFVLKAGELFTYEDAINILLVKSVNGLGVALAEAVAGTEEAFVKLMNKKAESYGLTNTHFANSHGLDNDDHYSTARELAVIASKLMEDEYLSSIVGQSEYTYDATNRRSGGTVSNTNMLLNSDLQIYAGKKTLTTIRYTNANIIGVKTGTEDKAGNCLIAAAEKDGTKILTVILKSGDTTFERFSDAHALLDWAFANFKTVKLASEGDEFGEIKVRKGEFNHATAVASRDIYITLPKEASEKSISLQATVNPVVLAPYEAGQVVGSLSVMESGNEIEAVDLVTNVDMKEGGILSYFYVEDATAEKIFKGIGIGLLVIGILVIALMIVRAYNKRKMRLKKEARARKKAEREAQKRMEWGAQYDEDHDRR